MRPCRLDSCSGIAKSFSPYCNLHRKRKARHGHPLQTAVTATELKPHRRAVRQWLKKRSSFSAIELLERLWGGLLQDAKVYVETAEAGHPFIRHYLEAYQIILKVADDNPASDIIEALLATGYYYELYPKRFQSEEAFGFQVARRFRALTEAHVGITWDIQNQRPKRVYKDIAPRTLKTLWALLFESRLPLYGIKIAQKDLAEKTYWRPNDQMVTAAVLGSAPPSVSSENSSDDHSTD